METSSEAINQAVHDLNEQKARFARTDAVERLRLIKVLRKSFPAVAVRWVEESCRHKGIGLGTVTAGEEWLGGPVIVERNLRLLEDTLTSIVKTGAPPLPSKALYTLPHGQVGARIFPVSGYEKMLFQGFHAEIWMEPGLQQSEVPQHMAAEYQIADRGTREGAVSLVLGAGNVSSIGPTDVFYKLFAEGQVVVLKMNPVNDYLGPLIEEGLAPLISEGYLRVVYGGAAVGAQLCAHEGIDEIHITGSDKTHDTIVWGPAGPERDRRKAANDPVLTKRITSELGNVSPLIIVPGQWSQADLRIQAENVASMLTNNASFNCNAAKLLITHADWPQREAFLQTLAELLRELPSRQAYYPGAQDRYDSFVANRSNVQVLGERSSTVVPWTLIDGLDSTRSDEMAFTTEAFCGVLTETPLEASGAADFLNKAVEFCNTRVWGTLNACVIVHPKSAKDPEVAQAVHGAERDLRYGTVAINHWPALAFGFVVTTWGAHPGHPLDDIQSGIGVVHNTLLFDRPQKTIVRGPFKAAPKPPWFVTNKQTHNLGPKLAAFERKPNLMGVLNIASTALRG